MAKKNEKNRVNKTRLNPGKKGKQETRDKFPATEKQREEPGATSPDFDPNGGHSFTEAGKYP